MKATDLPILGMSDEGQLILGGFFTAHDTYGMHCDWFMPMFLQNGFNFSLPYFAAEAYQHPDQDPDRIWPMLEVAHREARLPWNEAEQRTQLRSYLALRWTELNMPSLQDLARTIIKEQQENGKLYQAYLNEIVRALTFVQQNQIHHENIQNNRSRHL